ncbi:MAG: WG repeat-containing protein [Rikenellaceae bacterium]
MRRIDIINFVEALRNPKNHLRTLKDIELINDNCGVPIMYTGNRSVVFKAKLNNRVVAVKCYENHTLQFTEGLIQSSNYFNAINSPLINRSEIYPRELVFHDEMSAIAIELTIELYDWIDGRTIGAELCEAAYLNDQMRLNFIIDGFLDMAIKLLDAEFAHGDIKADNIIITNSGKFLLIDLNNAYIPKFHYSPSHEIGTNGFRHPERNAFYYNKRIDDYPIAIIFATLLVAQKSSHLFFKYYDGEFSIFVPDDILKGRSSVFAVTEDLFKDDIILSHIITFLKSETPAITDMRWWLEKLVEQRKIVNHKGSRVSYDKRNNRYAIADNTETTTYPAIFSDANQPYKHIISVKLENMWGFMSLNGEKLTDFIFEDIHMFSQDRVAVKKFGKYGFLNCNLDHITEFKYDDVNNFYEGFAVVKIADKYGYINANGTEVTPIIYDFANNVKQGRAKIRTAGNTGYINII